MKEPDYYAVLGVEAGADARALRAAYRKAAREHHPDRGGSAETFHQVQTAWEVLGSESSRRRYDQRRGAGSAATPDSSQPEASESAGEGAGFTYTRSAAANSAPRNGQGRGSSRRRTTRSAAADEPPVYVPPLSSREPLSLPLTSQKIHGSFASRGLFGSQRAARQHQQTIAILEKHVLSALPAARLFNSVSLTPPVPDRKGRMRLPRHPETTEHVLVCGPVVLLLASWEVPSPTVSFDGSALRAAGRRVTLPDLQAQARRLRQALADTVSADAVLADLRFSTQVMLLGPDADLFLPVVEPVGPGGRQSDPPLAAGRAIGHIVNALGSSDKANVVNRHLMAALRTLLTAREENA